MGELSQLVEKSWNYGSFNRQEDLSWGLGLGTGIQRLLSLVAVGEPTIPTEVPLPVTMVSMFLFDYGEFIKDALGMIPHHVQVHRHLLLAVPHTFSGLVI